VNDRRMRILNCQYRGIDRTTDVLSFPQILDSSIHDSRITPPQADHEVVLGDIVINLHKAERQTAQYGLTLNEELKRLLIHGLLHLTGYDHEKGGYAERKMKEKTRYLLAGLGKN
jgi:probable rRNA maturation factor